jgi:AhpD family alkylhydroperoxidase
MGRNALAERLLDRACRAMWGFSPSIVPVMVAARGPLGALRWFGVHMPRFLASMRVLGPVRAHLAVVVVSLRNDCLYCAHGHVYALELLHLRDHDRPFPLDRASLPDWLGLDDRTLRRRLHAVLAEAGLHVEAIWADRVLDLASGRQQPLDAAEARLAHIVRMVGSMNAVSLAAGPALDEAHDPVNKDVAVKARHAALRAPAGPV